MFMNQSDVLRFLPHRSPFLFVDSIDAVWKEEESSILGPEVEYHASKRTLLEKKDLVGVLVQARVHVSPEWSLFQGHFPNRPVLPGVIQIEMMAQAACFTVTRLFSNPLNIPSLEVALCKVEEAKFRRPIYPGMDLILRSKCLRLRQQMMSYSCSILYQNEVMTEASLLAMANV
jgi:3-hydroxyacyl-[acyl-carrier-protein] dehydratase